MKRNRNGISLFGKRKITFLETENHWPYSRLATRVIAHVTCLPTEILGECAQQITLALLP